MILRTATRDDAQAVADIFNHAIETTMAVWKDAPVPAEDRAAWIETRLNANFPVIIAENKGQVLGYASYSQLSGNEGYRFSVEDSIYVHPDAKGKGIGRTLLSALLDQARSEGRHIMVAEADSGNDASIALHKKFGFEETGIIRQAGFKRSEWRSLLIMQLFLDPNAI